MTDKEDLRGGMLLAIHKQQRSHSCWRQNCVTIFIENLSCLVDTGPSSTGSRFIWCCMGEGHERISAPGHCKTSFRGGDSAYKWLGFQFSWFATQVSHTKLVSAHAFPFSRVQFTSLCWAHPHFPGIHFSVTLIPHILGILIDLRSKWPESWTPSVVMVGLYLYVPQLWQLGCGFVGGREQMTSWCLQPWMIMQSGCSHIFIITSLKARDTFHGSVIVILVTRIYLKSCLEKLIMWLPHQNQRVISLLRLQQLLPWRLRRSPQRDKRMVSHLEEVGSSSAGASCSHLWFVLNWVLCM